ncbi:MAG: hypothetical protein JWP87_3182 [Labilithrix sp.]|nr:hypothetical protein [Labilithrix sp.]
MGVKLTSVLVALALAACGPPGAPKTVSMRMAGGPANASVTVDDIFVGTLDVVSKRGVALPPGTHRISVEAPGHLPWDKIVEAREGDAAVRLDVKLVPVPD